jgi:predicted GNAT family acetyltransferase
MICAGKVTMPNAVRDNAQRHRFELDADGSVAFSNYARSGNTLNIMHSEVPAALNGKGVGSALVRGLLDIARTQGLKVRPLCPLVSAYIGKHPEYADLLA